MPRWAHNKMPTAVKRRYFELIRRGLKGAEAARRVGVSTSCGSLWFIDAGSVIVPEPGPISPRFLSQDDRIAIADGLHAGTPVKVIAAGIGKSFQTVYREVGRNRKPDGTYQPWWAHNQAVLRRQRPKSRRIRQGCRLHEEIAAKLTLKWSPQQISRFLARSFPQELSMRACPETIYQALFTGALGPLAGRLRTGRCRRKPHRRGVPTPNKIKNMKRLDARPIEVAERKVPGHWEGDLIIGKKLHSAIGTLVERTSRFVVLVHLPQGYKAPRMSDALVRELVKLPPALRRSLTWDQGREMTLHEDVTAATGTDVFFCDPHSPWQRGTNENTNGLVRQYFPKHTDLSVHTRGDLERVAAELNQRPRLVLGDRTPHDVLTHFLAHTSTP
jgi:transposase, IS30 family